MLSKNSRLVKRMVKSVIAASVTAAVVVPTVPVMATSPSGSDFSWFKNYNLSDQNAINALSFESAYDKEGNPIEYLEPIVDSTSTAGVDLFSPYPTGSDRSLTLKYRDGGSYSAEVEEDLTGNHRLKVTPKAGARANIGMYIGATNIETSEQSNLLQFDFMVPENSNGCMSVDLDYTLENNANVSSVVYGIVELTDGSLKISTNNGSFNNVATIEKGRTYQLALDVRGGDESVFTVSLDGKPLGTYDLYTRSEYNNAGVPTRAGFTGIRNISIYARDDTVYFDNFRFCGILNSNPSADATLKSSDGVIVDEDTATISVTKPVTAESLEKNDTDTAYVVSDSNGETVTGELAEGTYTVTSTAPNTFTTRTYTMNVSYDEPDPTEHEFNFYAGDFRSGAAQAYFGFEEYEGLEYLEYDKEIHGTGSASITTSLPNGVPKGMSFAPNADDVDFRIVNGMAKVTGGSANSANRPNIGYYNEFVAEGDILIQYDVIIDENSSDDCETNFKFNFRDSSDNNLNSDRIVKITNNKMIVRTKPAAEGEPCEEREIMDIQKGKLYTISLLFKSGDGKNDGDGDDSATAVELSVNGQQKLVFPLYTNEFNNVDTSKIQPVCFAKPRNVYFVTFNGTAYYDNIKMVEIKNGNTSADATLRSSDGITVDEDTATISVTKPVTAESLEKNDTETTYVVSDSNGDTVTGELAEGTYTVTSTAPNTFTTRTYTMNVSFSKPEPVVTVNEEKHSYSGEDGSAATLYTVDVMTNGQAVKGVDVTVNVDAGEELPSGVTDNQDGTWSQTKSYSGVITGDAAFGVLISRPIEEIKSVIAGLSE